MIPHEPPRQTGFGFLYFPPYRVQGYSIAGEESFVQIPELDVCFDVGRAPRLMLNSNFVALTHGHMDHSAGLGYYFSQRQFQGMGTGTVLCHPKLAGPVQRLMGAWVDVEGQCTPHRIVTMQPGTASEEFEVKNHIYLRAFETNHIAHSLGFVVVEKRRKLKEQYLGLPQEKLVELKKRGEEITMIKEVPIVAYTGDTTYGRFFERPDVAEAQILLTECTFVEEDHASRAKLGKHMHIEDIRRVCEETRCPNIVLTHLSRRSHLGVVKQMLDQCIPAEHRHRVHLLMDHRVNRARYQQQALEAEAEAAAAQSEAGTAS